MMFKDRITISAKPGRVWEVLTDLERLPEWAPKCVAVMRDSDGALRRGFRFTVERRWRGDTRIADAEVLECDPGRMFVWRQTERAPPGEVYMEEHFRLVEKGGRTQVRHALDFSHSGIPFWGLIIMKVIHLVGRPVEKTGLMSLRDLVENREA